MKTKNVFKKLLICILICLTLFNFMCSSVIPGNVSYAASGSFADAVDGFTDTIINGITSILVTIIKLPIIGIGSVFQLLGSPIANSAGTTNDETVVFVTPLDIFFNKFTLTDINIFSTEGLEEGGLVYNIRTNAAMWYYIVRTISLAILLIMLIIIGIKMAVATFAEDKAKVKKMFFDWLISIVLIMFMHIIVIFTINVNNILIGVAATTAQVDNIMTALVETAFSDSFLLSIAATIIYALISWQTLMYLFIYIKRFLTVLFLVIISPIIPITYSIDKSNGGRAIALNGWLREFMYNVFVQTLHCIIYVVMVGVSFSAFANTGEIKGIESLGAAVISIFSIAFIKKAEELLREMLGFNKSISLSNYSSVSNSAQNGIITGVATGTSLAMGVPPAALLQNTGFGQNLQQGAPQNQPSFMSKTSEFFSSKVQYAKSEFYKTMQGGDETHETNPLGDVDENGKPIIDAEWKDVTNGEDGSNKPQGEAGIGAGLFATGAVIADKVVDTAREKLGDTVKSVSNTNEEHHSETDTEEHRFHSTEDEEDDAAVEGLFDEDQSDEEDKFKKLYIAMETQLKTLQDIEKTLNEKLENFEKKIDKDEADAIKKNLETLSPEEAKQYADSLGDTPQGDYAQAYLEHLKNAQELNDLAGEDDGKIITAIEEAKNRGMIDSQTEADLLAGGSIGIAAANKLGKSISVEQGEDEGDDDEEIDLPKEEMTQVLDVSAIGKNAIDSLRRDKTVREQTQDNIRLLDIFEGEATVEGDLTDEALTKFNVKILSKVKQGSYSSSNFAEAEAKVKKEGEAAVRSLEKFKQEQSEANARELSPAGKNYARLMVEAKQAGMMVSTVRMMSEQTTEVNKNVTTGVVQQTVTPATNNVIGNLNNRRSAQG